ncbi:glycosyltransferase 87 family protein [Methanotorris igneus]|nr:glycosyltransferase 87 family protein [Methanotorris igneus]
MGKKFLVGITSIITKLKGKQSRMRNKESSNRNLERIFKFFLAILLFKYSLEFYWTGLLTYPWDIALMMSMHFIAVLLLIDSVLEIFNTSFLSYIGAGLLLSSVLVLFTVYFKEPHFGTDGILFSRYAIDLLFNGENPYSHSMLPAYEKYGLNYRWTTPTLEGGIVDRFSYPPLGFLIFIPLFLLGIPDLNATTILFFVLTLLFLCYEARRLWLLPVIVMFLDPNLFLFSVGGVYDIIWVFFLLLAMKFFYEKQRVLSAVFLGLAISVKQTPALTIPFILIYLLKASGMKDTFKYALTVGATFIIISLPFLLWDPKSYLAGVLAPLSGIMHGMGLASLVYFGHINLHPAFFRVAVSVILATLLALYWINFDKLKHSCWFMPMLILWFHMRSLQNYFISFVPVAMYIFILWQKGKIRGIKHED